MGRIGLLFAPTSGFATTVWPPTGISIAALFLFGYLLWPGVFLGAFFVNFSLHAPFFVAIGMAIGNTLEALVASYLLKIVGFRATIEQTSDIVLLVLIGAVSPLLSAIIGSLSLYFGGIIQFPALLQTMRTWWIGDFLGVIIIGSLILAWLSKPAFNLSRREVIGIVILFFAQVVTTLYLFTHEYSPLYLVFPFLVWIGLISRSRKITLINLITSAISIWAAIRGIGPFMALSVNESLIKLQFFASIVVSTSLGVNALASQRKRVEKELMIKTEELEKEKDRAEFEAESAKKFIEITEASSDHMEITDPDGYILYVNPTAERITGYSEKEILGKRPSLWGKQMGADFYKKMWKTIKENKKPFHAEIINKRKSGELYPSDLYIAPILDRRGDVKFFVGVERDLTEQKAVEKLRLDFLALASHQLRTPLSGTKWILETLKKGIFGNLTPRQMDYLDYLYVTNERMIRLVADLLNLLRLESEKAEIKKVKVPLNELAKDLQNLVSPRLKQRQIIFRCFPASGKETPVIFTEPTILRTILESLIVNAIDYSDPGQEVFLECEQHRDGIVFSVHDSGMGIPENEQKYIFERFYRASNAKVKKTDGTGLGLALASMLAHKIGAK